MSAEIPLLQANQVPQPLNKGKNEPSRVMARGIEESF